MYCGRPAYDGQGTITASSSYGGGSVSDSDLDNYSSDGSVTSVLGSVTSLASSVFGSIKSDALELGTGLLTLFSNLSSLSWTV